MQLLKADTLTKVLIGPAVAVGDGFTPVTTLALTTADEAEILKHDAAAVTSISGNTFAAITSADGYYNLTITAAQLDTEGRLSVVINDDSLILPIRCDFMVVNANVFDSLYAASGTDVLDTNVSQWLGTAVATPTVAGVPEVDLTHMEGVTQSVTDLKDFADAGYDPATNKVQGVVLVDTTTTNTDMRGTDGANTVVPDAAGVAPTAVEVRQEMDANSTQLAAIVLDTGTTLPGLINSQGVQKNAAFSNYEFLMVLTSDHVTPATGLTVTGQRSIDGGAFVAVSGAIAEVSNGIYQFDALAADTNGDVITWRFSSATADDAFETFKTIS